MMRKKKIACGVVFYNPQPKEVKNISSYLNVFDKIYIYDNSLNCNEEYKKINNKKIEYIYNGKNDGLSKAYNIMCKKAIIESYNYICLLDQDSLFLKEDIIRIIDKIEKNKNDKIAIFCPQIIYKNLKDKVVNKKEEEVEWCISSGTFLDLNSFKVIGEFDENYFIDRVDSDYCYQLKKAGYKILKLNDSILKQELGNSEIKFNQVVIEHNPVRNYYIFRNRLYFYKKNKKIYGAILPTLKQIFNVLVFEKEKLEKLKNMKDGFFDFYRGKFGEKK